MRQTLEQLKPEWRLSVHVTAEYQGKRYLITHAPNWTTAEIVASDFCKEYDNVFFDTGDVYGSQVIDGKARDFRRAYYSKSYWAA
tara:strand:+ start:1324 stop:1578 length:255 start_codon:yes stop_codon:yes gene_type:complete